MKIEKGKLMIGEAGKGKHEFQPKVLTPTIAEITQLNEEELANLKEMDMAYSRKTTEKGSVFQAFCGIATNKVHIRRMYQHLKLKFPSATHITMAYRLNGVDKANDEGFCDDFEHGLGRKMLKLLVDGDKTQVAIFSVRHYRGVRCFQERFNIPLTLINEILTDMSRGLHMVSKLDLQQLKDEQHTVRPKNRQYSTIKSSSLGRGCENKRTGSSGASPNLRGGYTPSTQNRETSKTNRIRSYIREM